MLAVPVFLAYESNVTVFVAGRLLSCKHPCYPNILRTCTVTVAILAQGTPRGDAFYAALSFFLHRFELHEPHFLTASQHLVGMRSWTNFVWRDRGLDFGATRASFVTHSLGPDSDFSEP